MLIGKRQFFCGNILSIKIVILSLNCICSEIFVVYLWIWLQNFSLKRFIGFVYIVVYPPYSTLSWTVRNRSHSPSGVSSVTTVLPWVRFNPSSSYFLLTLFWWIFYSLKNLWTFNIVAQLILDCFNKMLLDVLMELTQLGVRRTTRVIPHAKTAQCVGYWEWSSNEKRDSKLVVNS